MTHAQAPLQFESTRLRLACWQPNDALALRTALDISDAHLRPWIPFMKHEPRSLPDTANVIERYVRDFEEGKAWRHALWDTTDDPAGENLVGEAMLIARDNPQVLEVGYWIHVNHCGKGYATEAVQAVVDIAFARPNVTSVVFRCDQRNDASNAIPRSMNATMTQAQVLDDTDPHVVLCHWHLSNPPT